MKKILLFILCFVVFTETNLNATELFTEETTTIDTTFTKQKRERFLPTSKRYDRKVDNIKFAYKGEFIFGTTVSYGNITSEDSEILVVVDQISANATYASVKPFVGYFYKDNRCVGVRYGYSYTDGTVDSGQLDLGSENDIQFDVPYVHTASRGNSYGIFHRSYVGLDRKGRVGLFAEVELKGTSSKSRTGYESDGKYTSMKNENLKLQLGFNPGAAVYILPNVCATLSFGFGGFNLNHIKQYNDKDELIGERTSSKMSFKFNVTAINIGVSVHMWSKK